jgi:ATP-dependent Clp protease ATP-binding subunit ClpB
MTEANRVTLATGDTLDLSSLYIIVTSNLGSAEILGREHLPFVSMEKRVVRSIERHFRPELLRRFGHPYVFRPLGRAAQEAIVALHLQNFIQWHASRGRTLVAGPEVARFLAVVGFSPRLGAGPLLAAIHQHAGDAVIENLLSGGTGCGHLIVNGHHLKLVAS